MEAQWFTTLLWELSIRVLIGMPDAMAAVVTQGKKGVLLPPSNHLWWNRCIVFIKVRGILLDLLYT